MKKTKKELLEKLRLKTEAYARRWEEGNFPGIAAEARKRFQKIQRIAENFPVYDILSTVFRANYPSKYGLGIEEVRLYKTRPESQAGLISLVNVVTCPCILRANDPCDSWLSEITLAKEERPLEEVAEECINYCNPCFEPALDSEGWFEDKDDQFSFVYVWLRDNAETEAGISCGLKEISEVTMITGDYYHFEPSKESSMECKLFKLPVGWEEIRKFAKERGINLDYR